jgi:phosphoglucan,water dikinase
MQPFEYAIENGFGAFEWFPDRSDSGAGWDETSLDREARDLIKETAVHRNIRLSVHAPWQANPLTPGTYAVLLRQLDFARDIGACILNIHLYVESGIEAYVDAISPLITHLAGADIKLSIENTPLTTPAHFNELFGRLRKIPEGTSNIGMCLDVGHANLCGLTRNDYLRYFDELHEQVPIVHVHLHENWGDRDSHLTLFTGPAGGDSRGVEGLLKRLEERNFSGSMILEQWPEPPSLLTTARDRLNTLFAKQSAATESPRIDEVSNGADEGIFAARLAKGNAQQRSWREKLEFVRSLVGEPQKLSIEDLVYLAVYLRFLGTGEVPSVEDGRHYRPSHAAMASIEIQDQLAKITDPAKEFVLRKILPWLPSSGQAFTRAEPLTRIRDIAHRNDIPEDLKREIKNTLQNKLHRCAGPEDLATSTAILGRVTAPGAAYSFGFVEQFKIFHEELKEFFNARSLVEQLLSIARKRTAPDETLVSRFLERLEGVEEGLLPRLETLQLLTDLRHSLAAPIEQSPGSETQELRLADIGLESFAFVLLSRIINGFEELTLPRENRDWVSQLTVFDLAVENVALSGFNTMECRAIVNEVTAWRESFAPSDREQLLRLKATVERSRRLADEYSERVVTLFEGRAERLGRALGVAETAIRTFIEGDIRGHVVFQLAKLCSSLLTTIRKTANLPPYNIIVSGKAAGPLLVVDSLDALRDRPAEQVLVLLRAAQGDEEIPAMVAGIILAHEIPYLSHLAVRARQRRVVFICCEDQQAFNSFSPLSGQWALLDASQQGVTLQPGSPALSGSEVVSHATPESLRALEVSLNPPVHCLPLDRVLPENGGSKAAAVSRLEALSRDERAGFKVPAGLVIPFGVMEECLQSMPEINAQYATLRDRIDNLSAEEFAATSQQIRLLVGRLHVPVDAVQTITQELSRITDGGHLRLMVRSSANCEDLTELAAAGLYESVSNVAPAHLADAVRQVWMSLWTERAAFSRRQSGIPHRKAHMAVLIQQMVIPEYSFILHTVNPISHNNQEVYVELAVGLGETLASAAVPGSPYRMICHKTSGDVRVLSFATFSYAFGPGLNTGLDRRLLDYSKVRLSTDREFVRELGGRLVAVARFIENTFSCPQDVEGAVVGNCVFLVQSRPQQGLD